MYGTESLSTVTSFLNCSSLTRWAGFSVYGVFSAGSSLGKLMVWGPTPPKCFSRLIVWSRRAMTSNL